MDKKVILAVAGAGKTYHICDSLNPKKKNLILAFTHENIHNILTELVKKYKKVPELTTVMTFDSFKYRMLLQPYEYSIISGFGDSISLGRGITMISSPLPQIKMEGKKQYNPGYVKKDKIGHYRTGKGYYYCDRISELLLYDSKILTTIFKYINQFYDCVFVDEFQDYRKYDYKLLMQMVKKINNILLVGDYYQHSVSGTNNNGEPFKNKSYTEFVDFLRKNKLAVDTESLKSSRRCSVSICDFIRKRLSIEIYGDIQRTGDIVVIDSENSARKIINNDQIIKLVYNNAHSYTFNAVNWSYSKGDTIKETCVILTDNTDKLIDENQSCQNISDITRNKLYVALTRSTGNTYIITSKVFKKLKKEFLK